MREQTLGEELIDGLSELDEAVATGEPLSKRFKIRKVFLSVLLALVGGCLASGCMMTLKMGATSATVQSIPEGMFSWEVSVPAFTSTASFDLGATVEFGVKGVKAFVGMLPMG